MSAPFAICHHGAVAGVTGSCHELILGDPADAPSLLVDCGLFQGAETSADGANARSQTIDFDVSRVKALLVTHCHIDHVGRIPHLLAAGFTGPVLCTHPTAELLPLVLEDAVKVGFTRDRRLVERFLAVLHKRLVPVPYGTWIDLPELGGKASQPISLRFQPAGHILGSAYIECRLDRARRVLFSGDLGGPYTPLLPSPKPPYGTDVLVIESTYGDRLHEGRAQRQARLKAIVESCLSDRGAVLIPAFSIGRTQELLYELEGIIHRHGQQAAARNLPWGELEIVVDSPLAARFTEAYRRLRPWWDREALRRVRSGRHPLDFAQITTIDSHEDHLRAIDYLRRTGRPSIVIAASGMCAGGRIVNYLKALLGDPHTDLLFVGYQAQGTPGHDIQRYGPRGGYVILDGQRHDIRAKVHSLSGYSAHADQAALLRFVKGMRRKPGEIRIVHGDPEAKQAFAAQLRQICPRADIQIPR